MEKLTPSQIEHWEKQLAAAQRAVDMARHVLGLITEEELVHDELAEE